jgi:hypothetical protein
MTSTANVYTGLWTNWSYGSILGSTLTITSRSGFLLVAFLAMYVGIAGSHSWGIICFWYYRFRASPRTSRDGMYAQQQALLRNSGSELALSWGLLKVSWAWRGITPRPMLRSLPMQAIAVFHFAVFTLAGLFSSRVTGASSNEVLLQSTNCGNWNDASQADFGDVNYTDTDAVTAIFRYQHHLGTLSDQGVAYARSCYNASGGDKERVECTGYANPAINWTSTLNDPCPFAEGVCVASPIGALQLDTGMLDSHNDLGINAPKGKRLAYRRLTTCAPVRTEGFLMTVNGTEYYFYGPVSGGDGDYTYSYSNDTANAVADYNVE